MYVVRQIVPSALPHLPFKGRAVSPASVSAHLVSAFSGARWLGGRVGPDDQGNTRLIVKIGLPSDMMKALGGHVELAAKLDTRGIKLLTVTNDVAELSARLTSPLALNALRAYEKEGSHGTLPIHDRRFVPKAHASENPSTVWPDEAKMPLFPNGTEFIRGVNSASSFYKSAMLGIAEAPWQADTRHGTAVGAYSHWVEVPADPKQRHVALRTARRYALNEGTGDEGVVLSFKIKNSQAESGLFNRTGNVTHVGEVEARATLFAKATKVKR